MERLPTLLLPRTNQRVGRVLGAGLRGPLTGRSPAVALAGGGVGVRPSGGGSAGAGSGGCPVKSPPGAPGAGRGGGSAQPLRRWLRMRQAHCAPRALRPPSAAPLPWRRERPGGRAQALPLGRSAAQEATGHGKFPPTCGAQNKLGQACPSARLSASPQPRGRHGARPAPPLPCAQPPP